MPPTGSRIRRALLASALLALVQLPHPASAAGPERLLDIAAGTYDVDRRLTASRLEIPGPDGSGLVFFAAADDLHGVEPWVSDGTPEGTRLLRDLCPGPCDSRPRFGAVLDGIAYFAAFPPETGAEIWRSDGTAAGTWLVADGCPGECSSTFLQEMAVAGGRIYYTGPGSRLWLTDGTASGTGPLPDAAPCASAGTCVRPSGDMVAVDGERVVFAGVDGGTHGREPWVSDGTPEGTRLLADLNPGRFGVQSPQIGPVAGTDGEAFFWVRTTWEPGDQLCHRLYTTRGDAMVPRVDTCLQENDPTVGRPVRLGSRLHYLWADRLWRVPTGALQPATRLATLDDVPPAAPPVPLGGAVLFVDADGLWRSDGTVAGTARIRDLAGAGRLVRDGDRAFFLVGDSELWLTDGTAAGTRRVTGGDGLRALGTGGGRAWFVARDGAGGEGLWVSDGTAAGTGPVLPALTAAASSDPRGLLAVEEGLLFGALEPGVPPSPLARHDLWLSDGSAAGTRLVYLGIVGGSEDLVPRQVERLGPRRLLVAGRSLLATDGLWQEPIGLPAAPTGGLARLDEDRVVFAASEPDHGDEPWVSDGTRAGTALLEDLYPGFQSGPGSVFPQSSSPAEPTTFRGLVLFSARGETVGRELFYTAGSPDDTSHLIDLCAGGCSSDPSEITVLGRRVYFAADDGRLGRELWACCGRFAGPEFVYNVVDLVPGPVGSGPRELRFFRGGLHFFATGADGREGLYALAGVGAELVAPLPADTWQALPRRATVAGDKLFFTVWNATAGEELWVSDGTPVGTGPVADLFPGPAGSRPRHLTPLDGRLLFAADDGETGHEPWITDGTASGTRRLADLAPGPDGSGPAELTPVGDAVFFAAGDRQAGRELWHLDAARLPCGGPGRLCLLGDRFEVRVDWRDPRTGDTGTGVPVPHADRTGFFWFFRPDNLELVVKVLDGRPVNGHVWIFFSGLTDLDYRVHVRDTVSGDEREYHSPAGDLCGEADTRAFAGDDGPAAIGAGATPDAGAAPAAATPCPGGALCLGEDGRFRVRVTWRDQRSGDAGAGTPVPGTRDTGLFWFFRPDNLELAVKVLDGRPVNGHFWIFWSALTDVAYELTVEDSVSGGEWTYENPPGRVCGGADTTAL